MDLTGYGYRRSCLRQQALQVTTSRALKPAPRSAELTGEALRFPCQARQEGATGRATDGDSRTLWSVKSHRCTSIIWDACFPSESILGSRRCCDRVSENS